jgi:2-polyprenyl-3-methyl-5-hydroxy-6-metoxy-1,4-benzoquinol methylase
MDEQITSQDLVAMPSTSTPSRGKPADYGQEIVRRRFRIAATRVAFENKIILDFGCGNGAQTVQFLGTGAKVTAIDIELRDLQSLRNYLREQNRREILPVHYDGAHLPVASGVIDIVTSFEVLEHVPDEATALREIHRVLKPGGEIIFSVPNKWWIFETHGARLPLLKWNRVPFFSWLPRGVHRRFARARIYRRRDIVRLLQQHSFQVLHTAYVAAPMDVLKSPALKRLARATFFGQDTTRVACLATAIFVHGRKL